MSTFKFWSNKSRPWEDIEKRFQTGFDGAFYKMTELVKHIRSSGLATRLYAYTSMDKLVISIDEIIDPRKDALHITYDLYNNQWHFEYFAKPFQDAEFVRTYPSEEGIEKFDNFIKMIRW